METLLHRISQVAKKEGISIGALEKSIGASKGVISRAIQNNTDIQSKWLTKIVENYPLYSAEWLLSGEGEMIKGKVKTFEFKSEDGRSTRRIPFYDTFATDVFTAIYNDTPLEISDYISIPNLPPVDGALYARGDSMSPLISSGDIVIFKVVERNPDNILWGHIYIITYFIEGDEFMVLKYIKRSSKAGYILLESYNPRFDPQEIPSNSIIGLALVKASITFHTIG